MVMSWLWPGGWLLMLAVIKYLLHVASSMCMAWRIQRGVNNLNILQLFLMAALFVSVYCLLCVVVVDW